MRKDAGGGDREGHEGLRPHSQDDCTGEADEDHGFQRTGNKNRRRIRRLVDVHVLHDDEVVIHRNDDADQTDGDESVEALVNGGHEHIELADEAGQRRNTGERE